MQCIRLCRPLDRNLRQPNLSDQSGRYEFAHRVPRLGERDILVYAVQAVQVDNIGAQSRQTRSYCRADVLR